MIYSIYKLAVDYFVHQTTNILLRISDPSKGKVEVLLFLGTRHQTTNTLLRISDHSYGKVEEVLFLETR